MNYERDAFDFLEIVVKMVNSWLHSSWMEDVADTEAMPLAVRSYPPGRSPSALGLQKQFPISSVQFSSVSDGVAVGG